VKVTIHPELEGVRGQPSSLTAYPILFLPPGDEVTDIIDFSPTFHQKYDNPLFEGGVEYQNHAGDRFNEPFRIDLTFLKKRTFIRDSIGDELKKINETLIAISRQLDDLSATRSNGET